MTHDRHGSAVIDLSSELEVVITREFDAPIALVFDVLTKPEHVRKWGATPPDRMTECSIDLRVGGKYHSSFVTGDGTVFSFSGTYLEVEPPIRTVETWLFNCWPDAEALETMELHEIDGVTTLTWKLAFRDKAARDHMTRFDGHQDSLDEMDDILRSLLDLTETAPRRGGGPSAPQGAAMSLVTGDEEATVLSRTAASRAVESIGWRYLLGTLRLAVPVGSLDEGVRVTQTAVAACGELADGHLRVDLRRDHVELSLRDRLRNAVTDSDTRLAARVTGSFEGLDAIGRTSQGGGSAQVLEIALDALDIGAIRPFWKAVLAYVDEPAADAEGGLVDPGGHLPTIWFQQMDAPRPQRNRVHFDITVAHDDAEDRIRSALEAGGRLIDDSYARSFWVLADAEGNEVCVCTWQDRDERDEQRAAEARRQAPRGQA